MNLPRQIAGLAAAAVMAATPAVVSAQEACLSESEVSAITIYSVPSLIQALQMRCGAELSQSGFIARDSGRLLARYARVQNQVWPQAKSGLVKVLMSKAGTGRENLASMTALPDEVVRPLVDSLIVQEASPRIAIKDCNRIERVVEAAAPIDPEIAGTLIGGLVSLVDPDQLPICPTRRS